MHKALNLLILMVIFGTSAAKASPMEHTMEREEAISYLVDLAAQNQKVLRSIDQEIRDNLGKSSNVQLTPKEGKQILTASSQQLEQLSLRRREYYLRQNFIDRLKFKIDKSYQGQELKSYLSQMVLELAHEEATDSQGDIGLTRFCNFLSIAIRQIPERNENLLGFIEGYMKFSSILNPTSPADYMHHRSYTNGLDSYNARAVSKENIGEIVEERLRQMKAKDLLERKSFEQRQPILKPLAASSINIQSPLKAKTEKQPSEIKQQLPEIQAPQAESDETFQLRILKKDIVNDTNKTKGYE